ncbi:urease accessory UreF family protein [Ramlibacter sp.]|uniref:urease accessory protein UreF n=1 Tax=Ramlibacter sp. TaxID=1917967 RepID=UPI0025EB7901|nr:urease accessory UreF family protein [Ramlibacter sp.]
MANTTTPTADAALLRLIWLASPALPVGGFSYSEGMESAIDAGLVTGEDSAGAWLVDQLHLALARADLAVLAEALRAWREGDAARIAELDTWVRQTRETSELRQQTTQMGRSLVAWMQSFHPRPVRAEPPFPVRPELVEGLAAGASTSSARTGVEDPARTAAERTDYSYPIAFALAAQAHAANDRGTLLAFAFGWAENMMQAALKAVPLGQSAGQRILLRLAGEIPQAVDHALALGDDARQSFAPMLAILSARHETQYSRLFRS